MDTKKKDTKKMFQIPGSQPCGMFFAVKPCKAPSASSRARSELRAEADLARDMKGKLPALVFQSYERRRFAKQNGFL